MNDKKAIYFITGNEGKLKEVQSILPQVRQLKIDLPEIQELNPEKVIEAKLIDAFKYKADGEFIVEDTSLRMYCLSDRNSEFGLPGTFIKFFLKEKKNEGLYEIAKELGEYGAAARTMIGYAKSPTDIHYFEGKLKGNIVAPRGDNGFGWDQIFQPDGYSKSFAELNEEQKNAISMRRVAVNKLKEYIEKGSC